MVSKFTLDIDLLAKEFCQIMKRFCQKKKLNEKFTISKKRYYWNVVFSQD